VLNPKSGIVSHGPKLTNSKEDPQILPPKKKNKKNHKISSAWRVEAAVWGRYENYIPLRRKISPSPTGPVQTPPKGLAFKSRA